MTDFFKKDAAKNQKAKPKKVEKDEMEEEEEEEVKVNKKEKEPGDFPTYEEFSEDLCSWKDVLSTYTKTSKFKNIYTYVKKEYAEKTVKQIEILFQSIFNSFSLNFSAILLLMKSSMSLSKPLLKL